MMVLWKIPNETSNRNNEETMRLVQHINGQLPVYATRAMKKQLIERYKKAANVSKAILRDMFRYLTGDVSAPVKDSADIEDRISKFLESDDQEIVLDLRKLNGNPGSTKLDAFWAALQKYFNEQVLAVQERRHGEHLYLPFAISVEDLRQTIADRLPSGTPIPSNEWIRLQFWPTNPTSRRAMQHTGRFNVKFAIQSRQIRGSHEDCHFAQYQLLLLKQFAVQWRDYAGFFWLDDKAIVPVGELDRALGTGVRPHNRSLAPASGGPILNAFDHDFHVCGIIPSVVFRSEIPEDASSSFFEGTAFVTCKDKIWSPSSALRHGAEMVHFLRQSYGAAGDDDLGDGFSLQWPIRIDYTDGGPDHRTTYGSVWMASIAQFILLDLDLYVIARTAPMGSWANLAERVNSTFNLALQNVALGREKMEPDMELKMKRVFSLQVIVH